MLHRFAALSSMAVVSALLAAPTAFPGAISYSGVLYSESGAPVQNGLVIPAVFKDGFDINQYSTIYSDGFTNPDPNHYDEAVADGNVIPLSSGVATGASGLFFSAASYGVVGKQIWLFGFPTSHTDQGGYSVLASGTDSSFFVNSTLTIINAANANQFIFGSHYQNGFKLQGLPFPEPTLAALSAMGAILFSTLYSIRRR
jgi:hypothetical protein